MYMAEVPIGSTVIDIVESTLPPGYQQTVGTNPTTVDVPEGGTATDLDGYYFPTDAPTASPTGAPTASPTAGPTASPTASPTSSPTLSPTATPTASPTAAPTPTPIGKVKGTVFEDVNNNGEQDPGEPGISGVEVVIIDSKGGTFTLTTDETGMYMAEVPIGSTVIDIVESTLPPGYQQTVGTNPTTVDVPAGGTATDLDGYYFPTDAPTAAPTATPTVSPTKEPCVNATVTFDVDADGNPLAPGEYVEYEWAKFGLVLSASGGFGDRPRLFDTANPRNEDIGGDQDLGAPNEACTPSGPGVGAGGAPGTEGENCEPLGNVLIIQEDNGDLSIPDDNRDGGMIVFDFFEPATIVYGMGFLDIEEESTVTISHMTDSGMTMETAFALRLLGDNSKQTLEINIENVKEIKVTLGGSGAVTFIDFCYDPDLVVPPTATRPPSAAPTGLPTRAPTINGGTPSMQPPTRPPIVAQPSKAPIEGPPTPGGGEPIEITIDFNTDGTVANPGTPIPNGAYVEDEWEEYSLIVSAKGGFGTLPRIFDTAQVGNDLYGDPDLGSPNEKCTPPGPGVGLGGEPGEPGENCEYLGNVLIIQEDNTDTTIPDDNAEGGTITLEFVPPAVFVTQIGLLDVDYETSLVVTQTDGTVTTIPVPILGDNSKQSVPVNLPDVSKIDVVLTRSAAVIDITYSYLASTPLPPAGAPTPSSETPPPNGFPTIDMSMSMSMSM